MAKQVVIDDIIDVYKFASGELFDFLKDEEDLYTEADLIAPSQLPK
ncbi:hypothetical protein [Mucilaginibacter sp.]|nr:hypothetical protein [Mucilaginibacter sp.]MDB5031340.1 hypothetical protein [Mucilaginibacter sp.]